MPGEKAVPVGAHGRVREGRGEAAEPRRTCSTQGRRLVSQARSGVPKPILSRRSSTASGTIPRMARRKTALVVPQGAIKYSSGKE